MNADEVDQHQQQVQRDSRRRGSGSSLWPDGAMFTLNEEILDKLSLLDYEINFCESKSLTPFDPSIFLMPSKVSSYPCFSALVSWLLKIANVDFLDWEFDDPSTASNNILIEMTKVGFAADFPASKVIEFGSHKLG